MTGPKGGPGAASTASVLRINLDAVTDNYRLIRALLGKTMCAAVVKDDAYGLGIDHVAPALVDEGCRILFVATIDEGVRLRELLASDDIQIAVLNGLLTGTESAFEKHRLTPVLNDLDQIDRWRKFTIDIQTPLEAMLQVDTGMNRLGLTPHELDRLIELPNLLQDIRWRCVLSHLACADEFCHPMNSEQLRRFHDALARLPRIPASLANSGGVFLGPDYHFDLARPGIALYGGRPNDRHGCNLRQTVQLLGRILQIRDVHPGETIGYGATYGLSSPTRIATVAVGYGDGYPRTLGGKAHVWLGLNRLAVVGRVSMDLITVDVSAAPPAEARPGAFVEVLGDRFTPDDAAAAAGTISYEILTGLGARYQRDYVRAGARP